MEALFNGTKLSVMYYDNISRNISRLLLHQYQHKYWWKYMASSIQQSLLVTIIIIRSYIINAYRSTCSFESYLWSHDVIISYLVVNLALHGHRKRSRSRTRHPASIPGTTSRRRHRRDRQNKPFPAQPKFASREKAFSFFMTLLALPLLTKQHLHLFSGQPWRTFPFQQNSLSKPCDALSPCKWQLREVVERCKR